MQGEKCEMRTKQALKNVVYSLLLQLITAISGLIIPRFFIALYGSSTNGLVSSIGQFISCMGLVEAGIAAAGTVALYFPISENDNKTISSIVSAARKFYLRSGLIFAFLVAILVFAYPFVVSNEISDVAFIRWMIIVLSVNGLVDYFFLGKYRILLQADQHGYIISAAQIIGVIVTMIASIILMEMQFSALFVKIVAAVVYLLRSVAVAIYVRKHYPLISFYEKPNFEAFGQRWAALLHQIVGLIVTNTDIVVLTLMLPQNALMIVSVYTVYNLVASALQGLMTSISNGLGSGFGEVIARDEKEVLEKSFSNYEYVFFVLIFTVYTCMASLMYPFIGLYSSSFSDGEQYLSWALVVLFTLTGLLQAVRLPGLTIICAAGHYRQTRGRAVFEAVINLSVSIVLVRPLGIVGVLIGTCASYAYRTSDVIIYNAKHFLPNSLKKTGLRIFRNALVSVVLVLAAIRFVPSEISNWLVWFGWAILDGIIVVSVMAVVNYIAEPEEIKALLKRVKGLVHL